MKIMRTAAIALLVAIGIVGFTPATAEASTLPRVNITASGMTAGGKTFTPRGANYIRLADDGSGFWYHSTYEPGLYDGARARAMLSKLSADGYNTVRTFIDVGNEDTPGVQHGMGRGMTDPRPYDPAYMDNVADFVKAAIERGIYTIPVTHRFPRSCYYYAIVWGGPCRLGVPTANVTGSNAFTLDRGYVRAKAEYLRQFSSALLERIGSANATGILAYATENEVFFETNAAPYSTKTGSVVGSDGVRYDMSTTKGRQASADNSLTYYTTQVKAGLLLGDPAGKLAIGFYTPYAVGHAGFDGMATYCSTRCKADVDYRYPARPKAAKADPLDVHLYPRNKASGYAVATDLKSAEVDQVKSPWIVGETGAFRDFWPGDITAAAYAVRDGAAVACRMGSKGTLLWTYDTDETEDQRRLVSLVESGGAVNGVMAPVVRRSTC